MRDVLKLYLHVRVIDGVCGGTPFTALLLALLGREVTLSRPWGRMDVVATTKALDLQACTLGCRFDMPASLMGANEIFSALCTDPLASGGVLLETVEIRFGGLDVVDMSQGDKNGESRRREVGVIWSGNIGKAQVGQVVRQTGSEVSDKDWSLRTISIYQNGEDGREEEERVPGDTGRST